MIDELNLDMSKTYIYEDSEYILTGRTAVKKPEETRTRVRRSKRKLLSEEAEPNVMVEIQPAPKSTVSSPRPVTNGEKKWVNFNDLFMVNDMLEDVYDTNTTTQEPNDVPFDNCSD